MFSTPLLVYNPIYPPGAIVDEDSKLIIKGLPTFKLDSGNVPIVAYPLPVWFRFGTGMDTIPISGTASLGIALSANFDIVTDASCKSAVCIEFESSLILVTALF